GPHVAPVEDDPPRTAELLLARDHQPAHLGMRGDARGRRAHLPGADGAAHVFPVERHEVAVSRQLDPRAAGELGQLVFRVEGHAGTERLQRERAVHGARVEEDVAQLLGKRAAGGGLSGPRGPVDGDDEAIAHGRIPPGHGRERRTRVGRPAAGRGRARGGRGVRSPVGAAAPARRARTSWGASGRNCPGSSPRAVTGPSATRLSLETGCPTASSSRLTSWCLPSCSFSSSQALLSALRTRASSTASRSPSTLTPLRSRASVAGSGTPRTFAW